MDKFNVQLCIGQKIYSFMMSNMAIEEVKRRGLESKIIKLMEKCTKYTITYKWYDTEVEIMSVSPADDDDDGIIHHTEEVSLLNGQNLCLVWFPGSIPGFSLANRSSFVENYAVIVNLFSFTITNVKFCLVLKRSYLLSKYDQ